MRPEAAGFKRLAGAIDIGVQCPRQPANGTVRDVPGHRLHRLEIAGTGDGKARFDNIHPHTLQCLGNADLFLLGHGGAGALLAVPQGGIEDK